MQHFLTVLETYGYIAAFLGSVFEGETVMFLSGILARQGLVELPILFVVSALGALCSDWTFFILGRTRRAFIERKFPRFYARIDKPMRYISKRPRTFSFFVRFMYGFRSVVPFSIGMSKTRTTTFIFYNTLGAIFWGVVMTSAGYFASHMIYTLFGRLDRHDFWLIVFAVTITAILAYTYRQVGRKLREQVSADDTI